MKKIKLGLGFLGFILALSGCVSNEEAGLDLAVSLYMREWGGKVFSNDIFMESGLSYYKVSDGPNILDNGSYSAVVKLDPIGMFSILLSNFCNGRSDDYNYAFCKVYTKGLAQTLAASGYNESEITAPFYDLLDEEENISATAQQVQSAFNKHFKDLEGYKVKVLYSVEDIGDGEIVIKEEIIKRDNSGFRGIFRGGSTERKLTTKHQK